MFNKIVYVILFCVLAIVCFLGFRMFFPRLKKNTSSMDVFFFDEGTCDRRIIAESPNKMLILNTILLEERKEMFIERFTDEQLQAFPNELSLILDLLPGNYIPTTEQNNEIAEEIVRAIMRYQELQFNQGEEDD